MKWNYDVPKINSIRLIRRFLLFPRYINGEARWLCFAKIEQQYTTKLPIGWKDVCFFD